MATRRYQKGGGRDFVTEVVDTLIKRLKEGTSPFQKPWNPGMSSGLPINAKTGNRYRGINSIMLSCQIKEDPRWMTFIQAKEKGWNVRKGEKGTQIQYWKTHESKVVRDEKGKPILKDGEIQKKNYKLERPRLYYSTVFNAEQIDGIPPLEKKEIKWNPNEKAEEILKNSGAIIEYSADDRAYYSPHNDTIKLPKKEQFDNAGEFYGVALHELGHWTGHESRLDREILNPFGSQEYAKEELRAEIASMILGQELHIGRNPDQNTAYIQSWITVLENEPLELFKAATDAEKIFNTLRSYTKENVLEHNSESSNIADTMKKNVTKTHKGFYVIGDLKGDDVLKQVGILDDGHLHLIVNEAGLAFTEDDLLFFSSQETAFEAVKSAVTQDPVLETMIMYGDKVDLKVMHRSSDGKVVKVDSPTTNMSSPGNENEKTYIDVPYGEKDEAKALGAKWDKKEKSWYFIGHERTDDFFKWSNQQQKQKKKITSSFSQEKEKAEQRKYLAVPYGERLAAKNLGAKWDAKEKSWYIPQSIFDTQSKKFDRWSHLENDDNPPIDPVEEFKQTLVDLGCDLNSPASKVDHPVMDGSKQRIALIDDKPGEQSGFYIAYLDGHPAGYIKNHRTNTEIKWKSKGYSLSESQKANLNAVAAEKKKERLQKTENEQEATAIRVSEQLKTLKQVETPTPYMASKGIEIHKGTFTDEKNKTTYIPIVDIEGKQWSMAYIKEDGVKRYAKDGKKEGCFHAVGNGFDSLKNVPALVFSEGYSTGATITQALGYTTVVVFDSGNLPSVTKQFRKKYPNKPIVICGDDDLKVKEDLGVNPGRSKAEEAANSVEGIAIFPIFAQGEQSNKNKDFTDFNDIAQKSILGKDGVRNQVKTIVDFTIKQKRERKKVQKLEHQAEQKQKIKIQR